MPVEWKLIAGIAVWMTAVLIMAFSIRWQFKNRRHARARGRQPAAATRGHPRIAVIVPLCGNEHQLRDNLAGWMQQDYFPREVIFVAENEQDPAVGIAKTLIAENRFVPAQIVFSGPASNCGQRAWQLIAGIRAAGDDVSCLAFTEANAKPRNIALRWMVAGLANPAVGIVTGHNWSIPRHQTLANRLYAALTNRLTGLAGPGKINPVCTSAWAIRRELLLTLGLPQVWNSVLCESWPTFEAVRRARLQIRHEPLCSTETTIEISPTSLADSAIRNSNILRTYSPTVWTALWIGRSLILVSLLAASASAVLHAVQCNWGTSLLHGLAATGLYLLGFFEAVLRNQISKINLPVWKNYRSARRFDCQAWPLVESVALAFQTLSWFTRRIRWRGKSWRILPGGAVRLEGCLPFDNVFRQAIELRDERVSPASSKRAA